MMPEVIGTVLIYAELPDAPILTVAKITLVLVSLAPLRNGAYREPQETPRQSPLEDAAAKPGPGGGGIQDQTPEARFPLSAWVELCGADPRVRLSRVISDPQSANRRPNHTPTPALPSSPSAGAFSLQNFEKAGGSDNFLGRHRAGAPLSF
ncbi:MAG: hypothetical protein BJ554DRAFT_410 [Olpidium bornovanus]|uniref:Uncharacterized protein n=1 Tax=Olpidium bornovanus TaxID=278681 RepID=A0A8H8DI60_9FUNG|nr:MAG: hypothetical protein BJ554DRAFT_410 [Olpidium bornovanus]